MLLFVVVFVDVHDLTWSIMVFFECRCEAIGLILVVVVVDVDDTVVI